MRANRCHSAQTLELRLAASQFGSIFLAGKQPSWTGRYRTRAWRLLKEKWEECSRTFTITVMLNLFSSSNYWDIWAKRCGWSHPFASNRTFHRSFAFNWQSCHHLPTFMSLDLWSFFLWNTKCVIIKTSNQLFFILRNCWLSSVVQFIKKKYPPGSFAC